LREAEARGRLQRMTVEGAIALGEALLRSSIARGIRPGSERPRDLARTLGVAPERLRRASRRR